MVLSLVCTAHRDRRSAFWSCGGAIPEQVCEAAPRNTGRAYWVREALPFALLAATGSLIAQIDVILVGTIAGAEAAGHYTVAARGAGLVVFGFLAVQVTLAPTISRLWVAHDIRRLQLAITRAARGAFAFALALSVVLWVFGPQFLSLFGAEFVAADPILAVLALTALVDVALGLGPVSLAMTGHQRAGFVAVAVTAGTRVVIRVVAHPARSGLWVRRSLPLCRSPSTT